MKDRILAMIALLVAVAALGHSFWLQNRSAELAEQALRNRDRVSVRALRPTMERIYRDMLASEFTGWTTEPQTLDELFRPVGKILDKMQGPPGGMENDPAHPPATAPKVNTFSIVARDPATGELGVAVQSKYFGVGSVVPWAQAEVGAVATQSYAKMSYGPDGLRLMHDRKSAAEALEALTKDDPQRALRQVGMVDAQGHAAAHTGTECMGWAGHRTGTDFTVQGNLLAGEGVVTAMAEAFEKERAAGQGELADWLMAALQAGQEAGGDKRGQQSAALLVVRKNGGPGGDNDRYIDLRVEDHERPIVELARLLTLHKKFYERAHPR